MKRLSKWVLLALLGCLAVLVPSAAVGSGGGSRIVFVERDGYRINHNHSRVSVINADGSGLRFLTPTSVHVASPRWSPDRSEIAYIRTSSATPQIWLMAADGTHQRALTRLPQGVVSVGLSSLDWSPSGRQIVFAAYSPSTSGGASQLYLANVRSGTTKVLLREELGTYSGDDDPVWSPNGRWIAFVRHGRSVPDQIFLLSIATGQVDQLTQDSTYASWKPTWSPDSRRIAFAWPGHGGIWVMNRDGSELRHLASPGSDPSWSPDGKWIVFASTINGAARLAEIRPNGSGRHAIKHFPHKRWGSDGIQPDW